MRFRWHVSPSAGDWDGEGGESDFNIKVREHRRKMGLLSTPSQASQLTLDSQLIGEHMVGVKGHLEEACQGALSHMRRDYLWKRLVYGQAAEEGGRVSVLYLCWRLVCFYVIIIMLAL